MNERAVWGGYFVQVGVIEQRGEGGSGGFVPQALFARRPEKKRSTIGQKWCGVIPQKKDLTPSVAFYKLKV